MKIGHQYGLRPNDAQAAKMFRWVESLHRQYITDCAKSLSTKNTTGRLLTVVP